MAQVGKGHAGNTAIVTAYVGGNIEQLSFSKKLVPGSSQQELLLRTTRQYFSLNIITAVAHATCFIQEELGMCHLLLK